MQVCTKQSARSSSFPHHQSSAVKLGICSILTLRDVTSRSQQSCCICTASRGRRGWLVGFTATICNKICSNQAPIKQNKEEKRKRLSSALSVFVSLLYVELGNGQNNHLDAHIYRGPFLKAIVLFICLMLSISNKRCLL